MRVDLTGRRIDISPGLRSLVERKLQKIHRLVNDSGVSSTVVVAKEKVNNVIELTLHLRGDQFMHAVGKATAWETAMTDVVAKVLHQLEKTKGRWQERKRRGPAARSVKTARPARRAQSRAARPVTSPAVDDDLPPIDLPKRKRIVRAARYSARPMTVDEAAMALEGRKTPFVVFRDARTDAVHVLYRRDDGQIALIEPEA